MNLADSATVIRRPNTTTNICVILCSFVYSPTIPSGLGFLAPFRRYFPLVSLVQKECEIVTHIIFNTGVTKFQGISGVNPAFFIRSETKASETSFIKLQRKFLINMSQRFPCDWNIRRTLQWCKSSSLSWNTSEAIWQVVYIYFVIVSNTKSGWDMHCFRMLVLSAQTIFRRQMFDRHVTFVSPPFAVLK